MHLVSLRLERAPGLPEGLGELHLAPGLNLVLGPNASGKSTLGRALRATLWPGRASGGVTVASTWSDGETVRTASLVHGLVDWVGGAPSVPPIESADRYALGLADLLSPGRADDAIAREVRLALSQGYDLEAALAAHAVSAHLPNSLGKALGAARTTYDHQLKATRALAARERELAVLLRQRKEAARDAEALGALEQLQQLSTQRAGLAALRAQLQEHPETLDKLEGTELRRLEELESDRDRALQSLRTAGARLEVLDARLVALDFDGPPPTAEALAVAHRQSQHLERAAAEHSAALKALGSDKAALVEHASRVLAEPGETRPPEGAAGALERELARVREARQARDAEREVATAWAAHGPRLSAAEIADLDAAIGALRAWLRCPEPLEGQPRPRGLPIALVALGAAAGLAGFALDMPALAAGGAALLGAGLARLFRPDRDATPLPDRTPHRATARRSGVDLPAWTPEVVTRALEDLETRRAEARLGDDAARRQREAEGRAGDRGEALGDLVRRLVAHTRALGLAPGLAEMEAGQRIHALAALDRLAARAAGAEAEVATHGIRASGLRAELDDLLTGHGLPTPPDDDHRLVALEHLAQRCRELAAAQAERRRAADEAEALGQQVRERGSQIDAIWAAAELEPGDRPGLVERLEQRAAREALRGKCQASQELIREHESDLEVDRLAHLLGDSSPDEVDDEQLEALLDRVRTAPERHQTLSRDIATIEQELRTAREGTTLADARAALDRARQAVLETREDRLADRLTHLVLGEARQEHRRHRAPPVLKLAQAWFGRFTHHGWSLEVDPAGTGCFVAVDNRTSQTRQLSELSDATRIQLLLAARLAAIEQLEEGRSPVPLCLDEVLTSTDPGRFAEVGRAVLELTRAGRQVLYFTASPDEVVQWETLCASSAHPPPSVHVLGGERARAGDFGQGVSVEPRPLAAVPPPEGKDADAYARRLVVPPTDGHRPVEDWHLVHVLFDDLPTLHRLLQRHIDRVGPWRTAREAGVLDGTVEEAVAARIEARASLLAATLAAWRVGRGRPPTWSEVQASEAISTTFRGRVQDLLRVHGRDPEAFVTAVAELPRFRSDRAVQLREALEASGCLDPADPLEGTEVLRRALVEVRAPLAAGVLQADTASALVASWLAALSPQV